MLYYLYWQFCKKLFFGTVERKKSSFGRPPLDYPNCSLHQPEHEIISTQGQVVQEADRGGRGDRRPQPRQVQEGADRAGAGRGEGGPQRAVRGQVQGQGQVAVTGAGLMRILRTTPL